MANEQATDVIAELDEAMLAARGAAMSAQSMANAIEDVRRLLRDTIGSTMPEWKWAKVEGRTKVADMSDKEFARTRITLRNANEDAMARACASAELACAMVASIRAKASRYEKLKEQAAKLPPGPEQNAANGRVRILAEVIKVLYQRLWLVVGDFALVRKQILAKMVNLTTLLADEFPEGNKELAAAFHGDKRDISNSLRMLAEMDKTVIYKVHK